MGALGAARDALGCLIWVTESLLPLMPSIMDHLLKLKKRVVMFHHREEDPRVTPIDCAGGAVCQMAIDNVGAGVAIGKRLLELGHRSICYLSYKREGWPAERYEGLARAFTDAGYPDGVRWISEGDPQTLSLMQRKPRISRESSRALADNRMFEDLRTTVVNSMIAQPYRGRTVRRLEEMAFCRVLYKGMEPALRLALTQTNVTAWVATEDYAALHAILPFLRSHRVRVPRDLSVVSINDQFESLLSGLTSYHFDMTSVAMRALTFLLSPASDRRLRPNAPALEPVGGFIIDRGSAGKPNRRSLN
jgi:DNA-binding LacI/PurR family transcriptional regulator